MTTKKDAKPAAKPAAVKAEPAPKVEAQKPAAEPAAEPAPEQPRSNKPKTLREPAGPDSLMILTKKAIELSNSTDRAIEVEEMLGSKSVRKHLVPANTSMFVADEGNHFQAFFV